MRGGFLTDRQEAVLFMGLVALLRIGWYTWGDPALVLGSLPMLFLPMRWGDWRRPRR